LFWQKLLPHMVWPRCWQNPSPCQMFGAGEGIPGGDLLVGVSTAINATFFEVRVVLFMLSHLRLRTSLKPFSWLVADFGVLDWPAGVLAISTAYKSWIATVYMLYGTLNRFFPLRTLQKFCLFSSAMLAMDDHCSLPHTEAGVYLAISSMTQITLSICFSCASGSGNCPIICWYSDFNLLTCVRPKCLISRHWHNSHLWRDSPFKCTPTLLSH
jgi:hypothetical protein